MNVELTEDDAQLLLTSLEYSKRNLRDAQDVPYNVRRQNLERVETVIEKLRTARNAEKRGS